MTKTLKAAYQKGWLDGTKVMNEVLPGTGRGADIILTYFAKTFAAQGR